jgi:peroxiredoxin
MGSDQEDRSAVTAYHVPVRRGTAQRSLFVVDPDGVLRYVNYRYRIRDDYPEVLAVLERIASGGGR